MKRCGIKEHIREMKEWKIKKMKGKRSLG